MDFSEHRLTDWNWQTVYQEKLGEQGYNQYFSEVWQALDRLRVNEYYNVETQVRVENRDLFIKICCQYILAHNDYEFSNDYTKIIRRECIIVTGGGLLKKKSS